MSARKGRAVAVAAAALLAVACSVPSGPGPLPSDYVPPVPSEAQQGIFSPDGFSQAQRMTVRVRNVGCEVLKTGTGFAVDTHTLVTNSHVTDNTRKLQVTTYDGRKLDVSAVSVTAVADIAIVTTDQSLGQFSVLAQEDPVEGDAITVVGYPKGGQLTTTTGVVLGSTADPLGSTVGTVLATTAPVEPGSSGSPALNEAGEVVGVIFAKDDAEQSYMIPVSVLRTLMDQESLLIPQDPSC